jgi:hypothetical protein
MTGTVDVTIFILPENARGSAVAVAERSLAKAKGALEP